MKVEDVAIIGAGPAGLATAIQLKRYGIAPLLLECNAVGGLLRNAYRVENYPGFPDGIPGPDLVALFEAQAACARIEIVFEEVRHLDFTEGVFLLTGRSGTFSSRVVVVASGTRPRPFAGLEIPDSVRGRIFYEIYPLLGVTGKRIAIVGAGDAAFDYALSLAKGNAVTIFNWGTTLKCLPPLWEQARAQAGIAYSGDVLISRIERGASSGLRLLCKSPTSTSHFEADYLVGAIGRVPRLDFISERVHGMIRELEEKGLLYFAGDVRHGIFRQTAIAVGDGILTGMTIYHGQKEQTS